MSAKITGGCACERIRYECTTNPIASVNCHCRDCQRASGSAFAADIVINSVDWKLLCGSPKFFDKKAESGNVVSRGFCADCGSPLLVKEAVAPDIITINVGSLDDPSWYVPESDWWTKSAQPWDHMNPAIGKYEKQPS